MSTVVQFRRGLSSQWSQFNPVLLDGELGLELNTGKFKLGTGIDTWKNLEYAGNRGLTGIASNIPETSGAITYAPITTPPAGWLPCDGSFVDSSTIPNLQSLLPSKPGFSGGIGAQYGTGASQGITISVSGVASSNLDQSPINLDNGLGTGTDYPRNLWLSSYTIPTNTWLKVTFAIPVVINAYWLADDPDGNWSPLGWTFQGSNNNVDWTALHIVSNPARFINTTIYAGSITTGDMASFSFSNTTAYRYYRWNFTTSNYGDGYISLSEIALSGPVIVPNTVQRVLPLLVPIVSNNITFYPYIKS